MTVKILIGCTGSVASIKLSKLIDALNGGIPNCEIKVVLTEASKHFIDLPSLQVPVYTDASEWSKWKKMGDEILHISLRDWADIMLIAPLDANTLGKLAHGLCDNLLTCVARAWKLGERPIVVCPAMNTYMWKHPVTEESIQKLVRWGYIQIPPISKRLACGDEGVGAMEEVANIVQELKNILKT